MWLLKQLSPDKGVTDQHKPSSLKTPSLGMTRHVAFTFASPRWTNYSEILLISQESIRDTTIFSPTTNFRTLKLAHDFTYSYTGSKPIFQTTINTNILLSGFSDSSFSTPSIPELSSIFIFAFFVLLLSSSFSLSTV